MAAENFDIVLRVIGGKVAEAQLAGVSAETAKVGDAQIAAGEKARQSTTAWAKHAVVLGGLYGGYQALKSSISTTTQLAGATLAFQRASGLDVKTSQAWVEVASERGVSAKQLQVSMTTLGRQLGSLGPASKSSVEALRSLGLSQQQLLHVPMTQRLNEIANAFQRMPNGLKQADAAQRLFGRSGKALLPILKGGAAGLREQMNSAERLVPSLGKNLAQVRESIVQQREWRQTMKGLQVVVGTTLIPVLNALGRVILPIAKAFDQAMQSSKLFKDAIYVVTSALGGLLFAVKVLRPALIGLGIAEEGALGPIGWIVAGLTALSAAFYIAYHHVKWFHTAVDAVVHFLERNWKTAVTIAAGLLLGPFAGAIAFVITHFSWFKTAAANVVQWVKNAFNNMVNFVQSLPGRIAAIAGHVFDSLLKAAENIASQILKKFTDLAGGIRSSIAGAVSHIPLVGGGLSSLLGGKAAGGPVAQTGSYLVGEAGPELVTLTRGQTVIPNQDLALAGSGGGQAIIHTHVMLDRRQIALAVGRYTSDQQKRR